MLYYMGLKASVNFRELQLDRRMLKWKCIFQYIYDWRFCYC